MTQKAAKNTKTATHIGKEELLELLSKKLGCPSEEVSFLFRGTDKAAALQELTIPDERGLL